MRCLAISLRIVYSRASVHAISIWAIGNILFVFARICELNL